MKFSNVMITGITLLALGGIVLSIRTYLDVLDKTIAEKSPYYHHCPYMGCPFPPQPYWETIMILTYIGLILCSADIIVLSITCIKQKMSIRK